MALLNLIKPGEATGKVAGIYNGMINAMGFVPNAFQVFSPSEELLEKQAQSLMYYMRHEKLSGMLLAFVRLLISVEEKCAYCVDANTGILFHYGVLPDKIEEIKADPSKAPLDEKELQMLLFVLKVVKDSNSIEQQDVDVLRNLGWSDSEILEATYHGTSQIAADYIFNAFKISKDS